MSARRTLFLMVVFAVLAALPAAPSFAQIVTVTCTGTPSTDGSALLSAYSGASGSSTAPVVVQPEPCLYDLGTSTLTLKNFVDLIGLGRNDTIITSQVDRSAGGAAANQGTITVPSGVDAEIANVTIRNEDTTSGYGVRNASSLLVIADSIVETTADEDAVAIYTIGRLRGIDLVLRATIVGEEVESARSVGLEDVGGDSVVSETLIVAAGETATDLFGVLLDGSDATLDNLSILVAGGLDGTGIAATGGSSPTVANNRVSVTGTTNSTLVGIDVADDGHLVRVSDTRVSVDGGATLYGVRADGDGSTFLANVDTEVVNGSTAVGLRVLDGIVLTDRSTLFGGTGSLTVDAAGTARVGVSKLVGSRSVSGSATCVGAYDASYAAIGSSC